ncbi:LytR C-terminal domain-containing protein [Cellulomonas shaoxiangyii]|uniref:LytR family transcriptional regulator n=1 Tax=Cellulomonas shaoxiangyii TaxID=2566013 RepID=A0A4P7SG03_9CELL|nr:LytR C-terminal domain-containing protein [Cellulomonas shaoxiangyii]QCB92437.1 LytR family transcriptional regulator [Cellulomonas shaoxiangyii]TGY85640.1 LytR family transcriptional regulator [Cellulomonas shaoxiangyii]
MSDQDLARQLRRRHMHERQAVVFGVLLAGLAVAGVGSAALYTESISLPFLERDFSRPAPTATAEAVWCPPEGALPVPAGQVPVNVLNGANRSGLAASTATDLQGRGFVVASTANGPDTAGVGRIVSGTNGIAAAYTLRAHLPEAQLALDTREDASVDLVLGADFATLLPVEQVALDPAAPLVGPEGCKPFAELAQAAQQPAPEEPAPEG